MQKFNDLGYFTNQLVNYDAALQQVNPGRAFRGDAGAYSGCCVARVQRQWAGWGAHGADCAAAGVNKALLYYYFESKEKLYAAALEMVSARVRDRSMAVFLREASPGERLLRAALDHFDRILTQREFQSLMQQEMMRLHKGEEGELPILVKRVFGPLQAMFQSMVREGIASGELIEVDWMQMILAALGANVFYFLARPCGGWWCRSSRSIRRCCGRGEWRWWSFWARRFFWTGSTARSWRRGCWAIRRCPSAPNSKDLR